MRLPKLQLYTQVLIALAGGALFGLLANGLGFAGFVGVYVKPVGTAFVRLISMVVVPLVFASLVVGTASLKDIRVLGRIGIKTFAFYMCTTAVAVSVGLLLTGIVRPGSRLPEQSRQELIHGEEKQADSTAGPSSEKPSFRDLLLNVIPTNPIKALADGQMLQIIFFALLTGICLTLIPAERGQPVIDFFKGIDEIIVRMVHVIMRTAPYGVFALIASVVADFGVDILLMLLKYSVVVLLGLSIHLLVVYPLALTAFAKVGVRRFFRGLRPAQLMAFCSSSSNATLPVTMECVTKNLGVPQHICSFTLPLGATINMDGTALYQGVASAFLAQIYGIDLSFTQQLTIVLTAVLASIGTAGIPGAGVIMLAIVLGSVGVPLQGIGIIMGVDRFLDMCRTVVNTTGDAACAVVVASTEGQLDTKPMRNG
ncbi:MAG TPA: dicarboxylate/amino acid:cation symporter [Sedimentisphaerales bacterium]|jgi:Na+/H+-dicarboxylate symporter|nr:dicarboxylate/amino acid:cation symporter [Sedimentisphaerales bacterium]HNU29065.1 dicarboxylate/amino acid:cation symporter [Sedimentisphaerales bacterium]